MKPVILNSLRGYTAAHLRADVLAGISVAMVALPLSIAIAIASGATPDKGLVTAVVAGFFISLLGGSKVQIGGPTGAFIVVVFSVIATHGYDGLVLATLMAGVLLWIAGLLRAGSLVRHIPEAVIDGFTVGIAVLIATSQIKDALGMTLPRASADFFDQIGLLWAARDTASLAAVSLAAASVAAIPILRRLAPSLPGLIVVMGGAGLAVWALALPVDTISARFGPLPHGLPWPTLPEITVHRLIDLFPSALIIAFLAGVESLLSAMVADRMIGEKTSPNAEVLAQGTANVASALFGGLPATGAIARTATNVRAGGRTPVAGIVHAVAILLALMLAAPLAGYLAMPALAALLMQVAWNMSEPHKWRDRLRAPRADQILMGLTLVLTVVTDLTVAIGVGVALGLALRLRRREVPPADWHQPKR